MIDGTSSPRRSNRQRREPVTALLEFFTTVSNPENEVVSAAHPAAPAGGPGKTAGEPVGQGQVPSRRSSLCNSFNLYRRRKRAAKRIP
jgi:hypothetical protein